MERFGGLKLEALIGVGGMASVYQARDTLLDRAVAMKILAGENIADPAQRGLLLREAMLTASINHPNVVKVFDAGVFGSTSYVAMELLSHGTLGERIDRSGPLPEPEAAHFGVQIASGLRAAVHKGLLHRDVKPGNILFRDAATAVVSDFGLAITATQAQSGASRWGTPHYISPERAAGRPEDVRSDIYSLGFTLFHALTGRVPFDGDDANEIARKQALCIAPSVRNFAFHISEALAQVIARTLHRDAAQRFQNYDDLIKALHASQSRRAQPQPRRSITAARPLPIDKPPAQRGSAIAIAATLAIAAAVAGVIWMQVRHEPSAAASPVPVSQVAVDVGQ